MSNKPISLNLIIPPNKLTAEQLARRLLNIKRTDNTNIKPIKEAKKRNTNQENNPRK